MDSIKYIGHNAVSSIDSIKMASLYFDSVEVATYVNCFYLPSLKGPVQRDGKRKEHFYFKGYFYEEDFFQHIEPLVKEKVVKIVFDSYNTDKSELSYVPEPYNKDVEIWKIGDTKEINTLIFSNYDFIFEPERGKKKPLPTKLGGVWSITGEFNEEVTQLITDLKINKENDGIMFNYYGHLLSVFLRNLGDGKACLTTSEALNKYLIAYFNSSSFQETRSRIQRELNVNPNIVMEVMKLGLPNISRLSSEDILELRCKLKDELSGFKSYLKNLQFDLKDVDEKDMYFVSKQIVDAKLAPALNDLVSKIRDVRLNLPLNLLKELKDPKSYSPLILSFTNHISSTYSILISLGLMTLTTAVDHYKQSKELKNNGLYYLLKLRSY